MVKALCIMMEENDEDDNQVKYVFEQITSLKLVEDMIEDEQSVHFTSEGKEYEMSTFDIDWFRFVPITSDMVTYFKNNDSYRCKWDEQGMILEKDQ
ncbi:hypothetical protein IGL98_000389 [Enterococcus sp. DIV0840]|uniref:hypothetical protein n=1 Tax=Enterococcus TaxID=1350 RepID=UPI001A8E3087|nr:MULTISPECIES: hypothetical protein [Enterococcus]MBO0435650.1 hypothetical protein [Enterococcus sp. DIV0849a]MBO0475162.1 hypothetical protein [Enterococcus ureasiticus]